jgi:hypothetical protein
MKDLIYKILGWTWLIVLLPLAIPFALILGGVQLLSDVKRAIFSEAK